MSAVTRSTFLRSAAAVGLTATAGGALVRGAHGVTGGPPPVPDFYGIVVTNNDKAARVRAPHTNAGTPAEWALIPESGAAIWRLRAATLSAFDPGEELIAFGVWDGSTFRARQISAMLEQIDGTIDAHGQAVADTGGVVDLTELTAARRANVPRSGRFTAAVVRNVDTHSATAFDMASTVA